KRSSNGRALLYAVGDVFVNRERPTEAFEAVTSTLRGADVVFGNNEVPYSERGVPSTIARGRHRYPPSGALALAPAGFTVMTLANNHSVDYGPDALADTIELLHQQSIVTVGAGRSLDAARAPARLNAGDTRIGLLAYAAVYPPGTEATAWRAGISAL